MGGKSERIGKTKNNLDQGQGPYNINNNISHFTYVLKRIVELCRQILLEIPGLHITLRFDFKSTDILYRRHFIPTTDNAWLSIANLKWT